MALLLIIITGSTGCSYESQESIIAKKDSDNFVDMANNPVEDSFDIEKLNANNALSKEKGGNYKYSFNNDKLNISVDINAHVQIPDANKLPILKVKKKEFDNEMVNKIRKELLGDRKLYSPAAFCMRKKDYEKAIDNYFDEIIECYKQEFLGKAEEKSMWEEEITNCQQQIDICKEKQEKAPDNYVYNNDYVVNEFVEAPKTYVNDSEKNFWDYVNSIDENCSIYYGRSDDENSIYESFFSINSPVIGNTIRYRKCNYCYMKVDTMIVSNNQYHNWNVSQDNGFNVNSYMKRDDGKMLKQVLFPDDTVKLSRKDAVNVADEFLRNVGINDFEFYDGDLCVEDAGLYNNTDCSLIKENGDVACRKYYILKYMRKVNGVFITYNNKDQSSDLENLGKKTWPLECIEFRINDQGIVGFDYISPLEITEKVVDNVYMKSFDSIMKTFQNMVVLKNADDSGAIKKYIKVDKIILGYAKISEKNSFTEGMLVPVWDFKGNISINMDNADKNARNEILTLNAIDGSVIDRRQGY